MYYLNYIKIRKTVCFIKLFILFILGKQNVLSQNFIPDLTNYTIDDYYAANQNWDVDIHPNGIVYIANSKGLLEYTGANWNLYELPNKTIIRSVFVDGDKIYTGSFEEFGYWQYDDYGNLIYYSLTHLIEGYELNSDEFWQIIKVKDNIIFRSFGSLFVFDKKVIKAVSNSSNIPNMVIYRDKLLVEQLNFGIKELDDNFTLSNYDLKDVITGSSSKIVSNNHEDLFVYNDAGGVLYRDNKIVKISDELKYVIKKWVPNKMTFLGNDKIAIGTIKNGVIIYNFKTQELTLLNKDLGLNNNTILGLKYFNQNLWCTLDNGLTRINLDDTLNFYKDFTGSLATVYDIAYYNNKYYLASNTGLYTFDASSNLKFIEGSQGQIWSLKIIEGELFCAHNEGVFYLKNNSLNRLFKNFPGTYKYVKIPNLKNAYLICTYNGIYLLKKINSKWQYELIKNINFPVNQIIFESDNTVWASHPYKGLFRIKFNTDYNEAKQVVNYSNQKLFKSFKTDIYQIDTTIIFYNFGKWFKLNKLDNRIISFQDFEKFSHQRLIYKDESGFWFADQKNGILSYYDNSKKRLIQIDNSTIKKHLVFDYEKALPVNDTIRAFNLSDGFALLNFKKIKSQTTISKPSPVLLKVASQNKAQRIKDRYFEFNFNEAKSIFFRAFLPYNYNTTLYYDLTGKLTQEGFMDDGLINFNNLKYGHYKLSVYNYGESNQSQKTIVAFKIARPWYLSNLALILYVVVFFVLIYFIRYRIRLRFKKEQMVLMRTHINKMQEQINQIEKENLKNEIKNKNKQLVNITDSTIRKNESIMVLYNELNRVKDFLPNAYEHKISKTLKTSQQSMKGVKDWKVFEKNFNEIHQDFFSKLIKIQPKLTTKDLRLCAYIKTGLTSKKIAPLMGISYRGVELHRYRLRKKLGVKKEESLSQFFRNI